MPLNDVYQAAIKMNAKGQKVVNVLHFQQTSADGPIVPNKDLCLAIEEDLLPLYQLCASNDMNFEAVTAHKVVPAIGGSYVHPVGIAGLVAEDMLPSNSAALATLYSATLTRQGRGRIFFPAIPDTLANDGRLVNSASGVFVDFCTALQGSIQAAAGATFICGVWSKAGNAFHQYVYHELRARLATLRSRRMENP